MKFAIIAAGEGSRLAQEGIVSPKPLIEVAGQHLIDRLMDVFREVGASELWVVCNDLRPEVSAHLAQVIDHGLYGRPLPLHYVVRTTPSSMHSFAALAPHLDGGSFVLTTVDTIFRTEEFARYVQAFSEAVAQGYDGLMGVTDYIDDERPLYVGVGENDLITGFTTPIPKACAISREASTVSRRTPFPSCVAAWSRAIAGCAISSAPLSPRDAA